MAVYQTLWQSTWRVRRERRRGRLLAEKTILFLLVLMERQGSAIKNIRKELKKIHPKGRVVGELGL